MLLVSSLPLIKGIFLKGIGSQINFRQFVKEQNIGNLFQNYKYIFHVFFTFLYKTLNFIQGAVQW